VGKTLKQRTEMTFVICRYVFTILGGKQFVWDILINLSNIRQIVVNDSIFVSDNLFYQTS